MILLLSEISAESKLAYLKDSIEYFGSVRIFKYTWLCLFYSIKQKGTIKTYKLLILNHCLLSYNILSFKYNKHINLTEGKMSKILGYTRVSSDKQTTDNQKSFILDYGFKNKLQIEDIIETVVSTRKDRKYREIDQVLEMLEDRDTLLVYSLDRLGRSTLETLQIIEDIKNKGVILIFIKDNIVIDKHNTNPINEMMLTILSGFAQLERSFISERTKAGLQARKKAGVVLGRKKGSQGKSKFDPYREKITELHHLGLSLQKIVNYINVGTPASLHGYIKTRGIKKAV